jgi:hypothetical protein
MRSRLLAIVLLGGTLLPVRAPAQRRADAALESLLASLELERRSRADDIEDLDRATSRASRADAAATSARARLVQLYREGDADQGAIQSAEESIVEAEARARAAAEMRHAAAVRLSDRLRRIAALQDEIARRRAGQRGAADPLTGRWGVTINPGPRRGVFRLSLDGTLVAGDYTLDGGFRGSLRGTFVQDKVTLQRIDAERGLDATFYGQLEKGTKRINGTWQGTQIAPVVGPTAGEWTATMLPERDETEERP